MMVAQEADRRDIRQFLRVDRSAQRCHPTGPRAPSSPMLSIEEEAVTVAFRRHMLLPLDGCQTNNFRFSGH